VRLYIFSDTAALHTRRWARWFALRGHEVHVISLNPDGLPGYDPAVANSIWRPWFGNALPERLLKVPIVLARLRACFKQFPPDIVHAHSAGGYAWMARLCGFHPYVVTPWGTDLLVDIQHSRVNRWLTRQALRHASMVTTDGFHFVDILRGLGVSEERIMVHTFGTDINLFSPGPDKDGRVALGACEGPVVISTRTLNPVHDVETFIRSIPLVHAAFPDARFVVVGDGNNRVRLESLAADLGVGGATRFTGFVDEAHMSRLLRSADVYVSTSLMDAGLAGSTAEAMATGLPVIQTNNSDNAYWTPSGEGGFLFPNGNPDALAASITRLLKDGDIRRKMGISNRRKIVDEYNMDTQMSRIEAEYVRLIQESKQQR
jgi:L-malate glycosyltransferase